MAAFPPAAWRHSPACYIIGWDFHEVQWRGGQPELSGQITPRGEHVAAIYGDSGSQFIDQYDATLLFVGSFEQLSARTCEKAGPFPSVLDPEFPGESWEESLASGDSRIYRRVES